MHPIVAWLIFAAAAGLEVAGDAIVRSGLHGGGMTLVAVGCVMLGAYGVVVNMVPGDWDFSRLLGVYIAVFAVVSILSGMLYFGETIRAATWLGLALIVTGGLIIQFGQR